MCTRHQCAQCDERRPEWEARKRATDAERQADLLEDLEWILGSDNPRKVAERLGYTRPDSLTRRLYRMGRADLARLFQRTEAA